MDAQHEPIYQFDPERLPDSEFERGSFRLLVAGNVGRLLDARRTPVRIASIDPEIATFEIEIQAFEDTGARWSIPFEDVERYQFAAGSRSASIATVAAYEETARRLGQPLLVEPSAQARQASLRRLQTERAAAGTWLDANLAAQIDLAAHIEARAGDPGCASLLRSYLNPLELVEMDDELAHAFVSNPQAGELVKGHAIVLAELGLCRYEGKAVRSPRLFDGPWARDRRATHIIARAAFTQELWERAAPPRLPLYRAMAADSVLDWRRSGSFVSTTFSSAVALDHFRGGPSTQTAAILRQATPTERLFMTFLETPAMSRHFKEAEAILIGDARNHMF